MEEHGALSVPSMSIRMEYTSGRAIDVERIHARRPMSIPMVRLDPNGRVVASFGANTMIWPHGIDIDVDGNIWVADARTR